MEPSYTADEAAPFDSKAKLARGTGPLLVLHGAEDTMIAAREAEANAAAARGAKLVLVPGRGHNDVSLSRVYWDAVAAFIAGL